VVVACLAQMMAIRFPLNGLKRWPALEILIQSV
jgi:hypothetical protein